MLKVKYSTIIFTFLLFYLWPQTVLAADTFFTDVKVDYEVVETGITHARYEITLENALSEVYSQSFNLYLANITPININSFSGKTRLKVEEIKEEGNVLLKITFPDAVVGKGKKRFFVVEYDESNFATRTGGVWEITIPRLAENTHFRTYLASLIIPGTFGNEAYVSPTPSNILEKEDKKRYVFEKENVEKSGINAGFGQFQTFSFSLTYHLENPLNKSDLITIAIPPDTSLQRIFYQNIEPKPENVIVDNDGNWLAEYLLKPKQRFDVNVKGSVQIFARLFSPTTPSLSQLEKNKKSTEFWPTGHAAISEIAKTLKSPKDIYEYVAKTLTYDYEKIQPGTKRLGAVGALENKSKATCMEYTDLFIALARANDIPAREINGFAYTDNPEIKPLSLVADVLHAWPEYWDFNKQAWIAVDPTWGSTTGGINYFDTLDLKHFAFVIHGEDPTKPLAPGTSKLGVNPQKDVFVSFGQFSEENFNNPHLKLEKEKPSSLWHHQIQVKLINTNPFAIYNIKPEIFLDETGVDSNIIDVLPPYAFKTIQIGIPFSFFGVNMPQKVKLVVQDEEIIISSFKKAALIESIVLSIFSIGFSLWMLKKYLRKKTSFKQV